MIATRRLPLLSLLWAICVLGALFGSLALAQTAAQNSEQLELLRSLTPEQRDALMQQLGIGQGGSSSGSALSQSPRTDQRRREGVSTEELLRRREQRRREEEEELPIPILKPEDSVIIEVELGRGDQPSQVNQPPGATNNALPSGTSPPGGTVQLPQNSQRTLPQQQQNNSRKEQEEVGRSRRERLSAEEEARLRAMIDLIRERNPYRLSRDGELNLPGFAPIPLGGLTEEQSRLRLQVEPAFQKVTIKLTRLPLRKMGPEGLKPFGYDLFEDDSPSTFAPVTDVPVPSEYVVGAGDELNVQLYGSQNRNLRLVVGRDGRINFPELGPITVGGQPFNSVRNTIEARVERQMIGVRASVSMGETRGIRVFVVGDAKYPGSYTVSGLGTMTSALYAAGGVKAIGSLRDVQLKRQGQIVRRLDLYNLLLRGDTNDDARLLPGDVIFIPPVGATVSALGEVRRPAIYEVKDETSVADVVQLAGGLTPQADASKASLTRIDENRRRIVVEVDPTGTGARSQRVRSGDLLRVARLRPTLDSGIMVDGYVHTPGPVAYHQGMRLSDAIPSIDDLQPTADIRYVLIRRELQPDRRIAVLSADLSAALRSPGSEADVPLQPRDRITVFDLQPGREQVIRPILDELKLQSTIAQPSEVVHIDGRTRAPGDYPLEPGMTVSDLIRAGGGLMEAAYGGKAELTRFTVVNGESRRTELVQVDIAAVLRGDPNADVPLQPFDSLSIKEVSEWGQQEDVELAGEVRFPGRYSIRHGETLKSVIDRAGGLTAYAFPAGSVFTRDELKEREQKQLDRLTEHLQNDLALLALKGAAANQAQAGTALTVGQSLLAQLRSSEAVGRLVIDLSRTMRNEAGSSADIILRDGDKLIVPKYQQEVMVIGEVQNGTSHLYRQELTREDYVNLSGGITRQADSGKIYVVRADGSVVANQGGRWFRSGNIEIKPGDTIVVPLNTERLPALPFWQAVTQIIYNLAISAAAVNSF